MKKPYELTELDRVLFAGPIVEAHDAAVDVMEKARIPPKDVCPQMAAFFLSMALDHAGELNMTIQDLEQRILDMTHQIDRETSVVREGLYGGEKS